MKNAMLFMKGRGDEVAWKEGKGREGKEREGRRGEKGGGEEQREGEEREGRSGERGKEPLVTSVIPKGFAVPATSKAHEEQECGGEKKLPHYIPTPRGLEEAAMKKINPITDTPRNPSHITSHREVCMKGS